MLTTLGSSQYDWDGIYDHLTSTRILTWKCIRYSHELRKLRGKIRICQSPCTNCVFHILGEVVAWHYLGRFSGHNRSKSSCFQVQLITCCDLSGFLHSFEAYSIDSSKTIRKSPEVLDSNRIFLKLHLYRAVGPPHSLVQREKYSNNTLLAQGDATFPPLPLIGSQKPWIMCHDPCHLECLEAWGDMANWLIQRTWRSRLHVLHRIPIFNQIQDPNSANHAHSHSSNDVVV